MVLGQLVHTQVWVVHDSVRKEEVLGSHQPVAHNTQEIPNTVLMFHQCPSCLMGHLLFKWQDLGVWQQTHSTTAAANFPPHFLTGITEEPDHRRPVGRIFIGTCRVASNCTTSTLPRKEFEESRTRTWTWTPLW